ncbi:MAG: cysteine desulfurase family protein [Eubacteriales bacterium]|nr:cysteine desulfurase family protein [Eubacteriales bacterium]
MHYLDHSATTFVLPEAAEAACRVMTQQFGNPSSVHKMGIEASGILEESRRQVAAILHADPSEITFTSCGTEAINTAIFGAAHRKGRGKHIVTTAIEHSATLHACRRLEQEGYDVTYLEPDATGHISLSDLRTALRPDTVLLTCMLVNNEVGTVLPVKEFGKLLRKKSPHALFHIDAVQGLARLPIKPKLWNADCISVSGHKIGAPKGIGALYLRKGVHIAPLFYGGGQERGLRPGTEPLPNIAAFGTACRLRLPQLEENAQHVGALADYLDKQIAQRFPWAVPNGAPDIPYVRNYSFPGCKSEVLLRVLEMHEVYVSSGSACNKGRASHVLAAMKLPHDRIDSALRISFSPSNTTEDIDALLDAVEEGAQRLKRDETR